MLAEQLHKMGCIQQGHSHAADHQGVELQALKR